MNAATANDRDDIVLDAAGLTFSSKVTINGGATTTTSTRVRASIMRRTLGSSVAGTYQVSEDPGFTGMTTWQPWTSTPQTASFVLSGGDGLKTVYVRVRDASSHINGATTDDRNTITPGCGRADLLLEGDDQRWGNHHDEHDSLGEHQRDGCGQLRRRYQVSEDPAFTGMTTWQPWDLHAADGLIRAVRWDGLKTVYVRVRDANSHINGATTDDRNTISLDLLALSSGRR